MPSFHGSRLILLRAALVLAIGAGCQRGSGDAHADEGPVPAVEDLDLGDEMRMNEAIELMTQFAERTGVTSDRPPQRYLWTDAFAVCNFVGLALERQTGSGPGNAGLGPAQEAKARRPAHRSPPTRVARCGGGSTEPVYASADSD